MTGERLANGGRAYLVAAQHIDPNRIGMVGFSAGGAVTSGTILYGDAESRLNFAAPIYGAFNPKGAWPASTSPLFLAVAGDDALVSPSEIEAFSSPRAQGLPVPPYCLT
jgi:dienelactone hydrolase